MTVTMSDNRTLGNLKANPNAAFVTTTGDTVNDVDGCRVYLVVREIIESGRTLEDARLTTAKEMGEEAAEHIQAVITFDVTATRPIIDMGQGV